MYRERLRGILQIYQFCYPILQECCGEFSATIVLIIDDMKEARMLIKEFGVSPVIIDDAMTVSTMKKNLRFCNSRGIFMILENGKKMTQKNMEKFEILSGIANTGLVDGEKVTAATFLVCEEIIPDVIENVIPIRLSDLTDEGQTENMKVNPLESEIQELQIKIKLLNKESRRSILSNAALLFGYLNKNELQISPQQLADEILELEQSAEEFDNTEEICSMVCKLLEKCVVPQNTLEWYELPNLESEVIEKLEEVVLLDEGYLYISEKYFCRLVSPLLEHTSINAIKRAMKQMKLIKTYKSGKTYTVKMQYFNAFGKLLKKAMIALDLSKISMSDGTSFKCIFNY